MMKPILASLRGLRRFARAERGATAVEFGLLALPLCLLLFGMLELGMVFAVSTTIEDATESAARQIRTGQFQTSGANAKSDFKNLVCSTTGWLQSDCGARLTVDVQTFATYSDAANSNPANPTGFDPSKTSTCWSPGNPGDIVLVRTYYLWDLFTPLLDHSLGNMGGSSTQRLIQFTTGFRNEPFNDNSPVGAKC
jgi:Flp pilus assembly protein TadG